MWNKHREKINWKLFYEYLNYGSRPLQRSTSPKESVGKSFKIKFFMDELPTMKNMYKRDKKKNKADTCWICLKEVETNDHWIECRDNEVSKDELIFNAISKILTKANNFSEQNAHELTGILKKNKDKGNNEIKPLAGIITKEVE